MSRWFRHYTGMMRDEKLVAAAVKSRQPVERVVWVWGAILESASEINDAGRYELDAAEAAYFLRTDEADVIGILDALAKAGRVSAGVVVKWSDRQYQSDKSADRQARYRERQRQGNRDGDKGGVASDAAVTSRDADVTPQEADTDTDRKDASQAQHPFAGQGRADLNLIENQLREASGQQSDPTPSLFVLSAPLGWIESGHDWQLDVLPTVRSVAARMTRKPKSWDYYTEPIREASAKRRGMSLAPPVASAATGKPDIFKDLANEARNGPRGNGRSTGATIDAVPSVPLIGRQVEPDDGEGVLARH